MQFLGQMNLGSWPEIHFWQNTHGGKDFPLLRVCTELIKAVETVQAVMQFACCVFACASFSSLKWPCLSWVTFITQQWAWLE